MDVISITQHRESPRELLRRRFSAVSTHAAEGLSACLKLEGSLRSLAAGENIISDEPQPKAWLLVSGVAGEVRRLSDRRQVLTLRLPGDILQQYNLSHDLVLAIVLTIVAYPWIRRIAHS